MAKISQQLIDKIINRANIAEVISKFITIQKQGSNYLSVCPFHSDTNPSMHISPVKKIYKCFVCGSGGNSITFIQEFKNMSFYDALKFLTEMYKIETTEFNNISVIKKYSNSEIEYFKINEDASLFFRVMLDSKIGEEAKKYLFARGFSNEQINKWNVGFSYKNAQILENLISKNHLQKDIVDVGIVTLKDSNIYNYFMDRIIFPIKDIDENIIGFSGRIYKEQNDNSPKYLNTRETLIFKKSNYLFNANNAKRYAKIDKYILLLEGYMDVIALDKIGIHNVVALMGTNLSQTQLKIIKSMTNEVRIFLDGDKPGVKAAIEIAKKLLQANISVSIVNNLTENDPDELVSLNKHEELKEIINDAEHPINYAMNYYEKNIDISDFKHRDEYLNKIIDIIKYIQDDLIIDSVVNKLSSKLTVSANLILKKIQEYKIPFDADKKITPSKNDYPKIIDNNIENKSNNSIEQQFYKTVENKIWINIPAHVYRKAENDVVWNLINNSDFSEYVNKNLENFISPIKKNISKIIIDAYINGELKSNDYASIYKIIENNSEKYKENLQEIQNIPLPKKYSSEKGMKDAFLKLEEYVIKRERNDLAKKFIDSNSNDKKKSVFRRIISKDEEFRNLKRKYEDTKNGNKY
ncbi:DNA primase [Spiroplasma endosymbiont of Labia minor]|uniref:DNA primase n=1 Tax=Spiroplasma endosymbiont of Labia minor TaxID=3066305 RepID=UPI0030D1FC78